MENEKKAYAEIWAILEQLEKNDKNKIPKEILETIENKREKEYKIKINLDIPLKEQKISDKTIELLCYLELNYLATPEQKEKLIKVYENSKKRFEQKVDINRIFEEKRKQIVPVVIEKEYNWYHKIWRKIKSLFVKKK